MYFGAQSLFLLLALRFLHGIGFGMATTATGTIVTDVAPAHRRGEALAYFGVFMSLPMVGGFWFNYFSFSFTASSSTRRSACIFRRIYESADGNYPF